MVSTVNQHCCGSVSGFSSTRIFLGIVIISVIMVLVTDAYSQNFPYKKLRQHKIQAGSVTGISIDRLGGFYLTSDCGIQRFNPEGIENGAYHPRGCTPTQLLEAWNPARIFAYQKSKRSFLVFDHELDLAENIKIDSAIAIEPLLATPGNDNRSYWVLDEDLSIKKVETSTNKVLLETGPIVIPSANRQFVHMREFQNFLFLLDESECIYMINNVGHIVKKIDAKGANYFSVLGEDLYFLQDNTIHFFDIFTDHTYQVKVPADIRFVVATDERLILIKDSLFEVFEFTPEH